eukprot:COSAG06_NODE_7670_length_2419_cov_2.534914_2_plen_77_part_00
MENDHLPRQAWDKCNDIREDCISVGGGAFARPSGWWPHLSMRFLRGSEEALCEKYRFESPSFLAMKSDRLPRPFRD